MPNLYHTIEILKPLYETAEGYCVGVYDRHIKEAIKNKQYLVVKTMGEETIVYPKWVRTYCKKIKKVFLRPQQPMTLYEIFVSKKSEEDKLKELFANKVFG